MLENGNDATNLLFDRECQPILFIILRSQNSRLQLDSYRAPDYHENTGDKYVEMTPEKVRIMLCHVFLFKQVMDAVCEYYLFFGNIFTVIRRDRYNRREVTLGHKTMS